jgi:hypothetical protein
MSRAAASARAYALHEGSTIDRFTSPGDSP